ncbi:hypothetical protein M3Y98_00190300 [Aphelenchoides besseyi]|nr:hypothetical protein M3Y98_00190300 [Aphelenchoides besseyi]KAI6200205.1 hypothetical protein M3Y96_00708200 [Aphelenchoides besseyi]
MHSHVAMDDKNSNNTETAKNRLPRCSSNSAMIICTKDVANECPEGGERSQVCTLSDRSRCCQNVLQGIPVSYINAKLGDCPPPIGISGSQLGIENNCWLDSNCPGIQKCCLEPNPVDQHSNRICRDPVGISRKLGSSVCNLPLAVGSCDSPVQRYYYDASSGLCKTFQFSGTPLCPADANAAIACGVPHADSCQTDEDCLGRQNLKSPTCCMSRCGYRLCYLY